MSGHSKWSTIKRQKQSEDKKRGQAFTKLARAITLAVSEAGGNTDPGSNFKLRLGIEKAKQYNMPKDNIARAIERGSGTGDSAVVLELVVYEGYGPGGVGIIIESATDNKQRTSAQVKHLLDRFGGSLGGSGSVAFQFEQQGCIVIPRIGVSEDELFEKAVASGATDMESDREVYEVYTARQQLHTVSEVLKQSGVSFEDAKLVYRPTIIVPVTESGDASRLVSLLTELEELDDVQAVYTNADIKQEDSS
ncbi:YebC/PmpR family DNA-binding transcriptional regulator [Candidatus Roizmanbacteria bacterium]|nr:YebC/PmpR family DNA-binding transcriptional regulator [Candidatus Roizmanbacteria bacterium]